MKIERSFVDPTPPVQVIVVTFTPSEFKDLQAVARFAKGHVGYMGTQHADPLLDALIAA